MGRLLTGFATGSYSVIVPLFTSEIAEKEIRGTLGTYFQLQVTGGILFTYVVGSYVSLCGKTGFVTVEIIFFATRFLFTVWSVRLVHHLRHNSDRVRLFDGFDTRESDFPSDERKRRKSTFVVEILPRTIWRRRPRTVHNARLVSQGMYWGRCYLSMNLSIHEYNIAYHIRVRLVTAISSRVQ